MKIVTVTLNPALDKTAVLDELLPGGLNRLRGIEVDAGGKGVNVSKMVRALGGDSLAVGFVGGGSGKEIVRALDEGGIPHAFIETAGTTRTNLKVIDQGDRLTELNEPGAVISQDEILRLLASIRDLAGPESLFVFSGSLPGGVETGIYGAMIATVRAEGSLAFLDADGEAFRAALTSRPDFIKPNRHELLEYFGQSGELSLKELANLCRTLVEDGISRVALSMGAEGALFVDAAEALHAPGLEVEARSSVGAGDSMVGAIACATARGMDWRSAAALAMAASAGAVTTSGTRPPSRELVDGLIGRVRLLPV